MQIRLSKIFSRIKKTALAAVAVFFIFAPPGTMIGIFLLLAALVGNVWIVAGAACLLIAAGLLLFIIKQRRKKGV